MTMKKQRQHARYPLSWRIALIFDETGERVALHGKTRDLSLYGAAMHTHHNVVGAGTQIVLMAPPPLSKDDGQTIIEIKARIVYSVYSSENMCFRVGLQFTEFMNDSRAVLQARLEHHTPAFEAAP